MDNPILPTSATGSATQGSTSTRLLVQIQQGLDGLTSGKTVEALVIGKDGKGNPLLNLKLQATKLELPFSSRIPLSQGTKLELKIIENSFGNDKNSSKTKSNKPGVLQAQILKINGEAPHKPAGTTTNISSGEAGQNKPQPFDVIRAILPNFVGKSGKLPQINNLAATNPSTIISSGTNIQASLLTLKDGAADYLPKNILQNNAQLGAYQKAGADGQNITSPATTLKAGSNIVLQLISNNLPAATNTTTNATQNIPAPPGTQTFTATVIGTAEQSGNLVLKSPLGTIELANNINLPKGAELKLAIIATGNLGASVNNAPITIDTIRQQIIYGDSEFHNLLRALDGLETLEALQAKDQLIPQNNKQSAARLLWFMGGIQSGDAERWMGKEIRRQLENAGHKDLLSKLDQQFNVMREAFQKPNEAGWNSMLFPFHDGDKIQLGLFYSRRHKSKDQKNNDKDNLRFVVELGLDKLGDVQIDGLVQDDRITPSGNIRKTLSLVIRSKTSLPKNMQKDIYQIFGDAIMIGGIEGNIRFDAVKNFPVHPDYASTDDHHGDFVV